MEAIADEDPDAASEPILRLTLAVDVLCFPGNEVGFTVKAFLPKRPAVVEASIVLAVFLVGLVSTVVGEAPHPADSDALASFPEGSSCPDPTDQGGPCSPTCQCTCCPGHWTGATFSDVRPSLDTLPTDEVETSLPDDLHPQDAINRIFHPPRA